MKLSRRRFLEGAAALGAGTLLPRSLRGLASGTDRAANAESGPLAGPGRLFSAPHPERFDPWVEVIPEHLRHNLAEVRRLAADRPVLAVLKNNAYGLELETAGPLLDPEPGIWGFAVVKGEEAVALRKAGVRKPILLMGMFDPEEGPELAEAGVHLSAYTPDAAERFTALARRLGRPVQIHFYLDTGMGRMGMPYRNALPWMRDLASRPEVRVRGTYMALTEDRDFDPEQLRRFLELVEGARADGVPLGRLHAAASNGVFHFPDSHLDLVRPGMAIYGCYPSDPESERKAAHLRPAVRLRARVIRVAHLEAGETIGYGRAWTAERPTWIATLPVGHADGYPREAVQGARVMIRDRIFPVVGAVTASHAEVELGPEPVVEVGDVATLMGPDDPTIEPNTLAGAIGVSVYDLLMHLNPKLPRILAPAAGTGG